jgi:hypothetical protein
MNSTASDGHSRPQGVWRFNRTAVQWALLAALCVVAIAYFAMPSRAASDCSVLPSVIWQDKTGELPAELGC